ncbi:hypothetical protein M0R45_015884 [Rubus argutus]|uniref:Uncharacterized protein n=1 Tax=Rubus argutus TaxID=59490 RepID=A0AAW1XTH8_RUBAR
MTVHSVEYGVVCSGRDLRRRGSLQGASATTADVAGCEILCVQQCWSALKCATIKSQIGDVTVVPSEQIGSAGLRSW